MLQHRTGGGNYFKANLLGGEAGYDVFFVEEISILVEGGHRKVYDLCELGWRKIGLVLYPAASPFLYDIDFIGKSI
jgi:hypothetical protein